MTIGAETHIRLREAGYGPYLSNLQVAERCIRFDLSAAGRAKLRDDPRFAKGILYGLHLDVGSHLADYRSHPGTVGKGSVQIVIDQQTGRAYADVDRFGANSDLAGFLGHGLVEVLWPRLKRLAFWKRKDT